MTLKAVVETLDDVDSAFHGEYVERGGKFYLDVDASIKEHSDVLPLARSLTSLKADKVRLQEKLTAAEARVAGLPDDFDPTTYAEVKAEYDRLKADPNYKGGGEAGQQMRDQFESRIRNLETAHAQAISAEQQKTAGLERELNGRVVGDDLTEALTKAGVDPKFLKATRAMLGGAVKVVSEDDGRRRAVVDTDLGEVAVEQYVETWAKSDEGKAFVVPPSGGGANGSDVRRVGENPFSHDNWDQTKQGALVREKGMAEATRLAKIAGTTVGGPRPPKK